MRKIIIWFCCLITFPVFAEYGVLNGKLTEVRVNTAGVVILSFDTEAVGSPPACSSATRAYMTFSLLEPGGDGMLSTALSAHATRTTLVAKGNGQCKERSDFESITYLVIKN